MAELAEPLTDTEADYCLDLKVKAMGLRGAQLRAFRASLRKMIHRMRQGCVVEHVEEDQLLGFKKLIESQFKHPMNWENFTFEWDLSAKDPLKIITVYEWQEEGGTFENRVVPDDRGNPVNQKFCQPTAFTRQEI